MVHGHLPSVLKNANVMTRSMALRYQHLTIYDRNIYLNRFLVAFVHQRVLMAPLLYLAAIGVSFVSLLVAKLLFVGVALLYILPNPLDHYHHTQLSMRE